MRETSYLPRPPTSTWAPEILHAGSCPGSSYIFQVSWKSVQGSRSCGGRKSPSPIDKAHGLYTACRPTTVQAVINETLWEFLTLGDYRSLQFFRSLELLVVADSLLKSTPKSVIHGINIRAIWRSHVRFNEVDVLFFQIIYRGPGGVRWRFILQQCPPVMTTYCSVRQQTLLEDDIAVRYCSC